jgi:diphthine synthase
VHNASIMNAVGCCGLQLYNYGETVSIPFWDANWEPESFYDKIAVNLDRGQHTLCLLDIKVKEQTVENMMRKRKIYEPARYRLGFLISRKIKFPGKAGIKMTFPDPGK